MTDKPFDLRDYVIPPDFDFAKNRPRAESTASLQHEYRELSELEQEQVRAIKDAGQLMLDLIVGLAPSVPSDKGHCLAIGRTKIEEAVMWIVKGITL